MAIRQIPGVRDAVQYTVPVPATVEKIRQGQIPVLTPRQAHQRICYVVAEPGADTGEIEETIKTMPGYFADYDTTVHFITGEEFATNHTGMPHGGCVIRTGTTGGKHKQQTEFRLALESNPQFTGSVLTACARAVYRMHKTGAMGACTIFDLPLGYLSPRPPADLRKNCSSRLQHSCGPEASLSIAFSQDICKYPPATHRRVFFAFYHAARVPPLDSLFLRYSSPICHKPLNAIISKGMLGHLYHHLVRYSGDI